MADILQFNRGHDILKYYLKSFFNFGFQMLLVEGKESNFQSRFFPRRLSFAVDLAAKISY